MHRLIRPFLEFTHKFRMRILAREEALRAKNRELLARNRIASMSRGTLNLDRIIDEVLAGVRDGLGFEASFLVLVEEKTGRYHLRVERGRPQVDPISRILGFDLQQIEIPPEATENPIVQAMRRKKVVIRYELSVLAQGVLPAISHERAAQIQKGFGYGKFVVAPLVAEQQTLGAIVAITRKAWIEQEVIQTLEGFADQSALAIDNVRLLEELKFKNLELEKASRAKSEFLAAMSHELRTPLNAIIGFSDLMAENALGNLNPEQQQSLQAILGNGESLLRLINGLLDLAKIESGKMELQLGLVDMADLVQRVKGMINSLLIKRGQSFELQITPGLQPVIQADEAKLQQVLFNLFSNAIKFTPEQGRISVILREQEGGLEVSVEDTGIGIPEAEVEKVFDLFHQAKRPNSIKTQGTGLGLTLAKQFVELHGGKIWVKSRPGAGACVTFLLPKGS